MSRRSMVLAGAILAGVAGLAVPGASPAAAEGPTGGAQGDGQGRYTAYVEISGNGAGSGGDLAGPPVSSGGGGGRVSVPSPCGYQRGETQQEVEAAYLQMAKGDVEWAKQLLLGQANKMDSLSQYSFPSSTLKAKLQYENWGRTGTWYDSICDASVSNADFRDYVYNEAPPVLTNGGPPPPPPLIADPQLLHDIAVRAMTLPDPAVQVVNPRTVVRLDTYVWVRPDDTAQRQVTAAVPGLSVTVTATAQGVNFTTTGAPTADCGVVRAQTPSCALTWTRSSARAAGQKFAVVAHVDWTATATDGIPVPGATMDSPGFGVTVLEVQTVNGGGNWRRTA